MRSPRGFPFPLPDFFDMVDPASRMNRHSVGARAEESGPGNAACQVTARHRCAKAGGRSFPPSFTRKGHRKMSNLTEALTGETKKTAVVDDCLELIDAEVADKGGLSGLAIKAGYGVVKGIKPGFIKQAVGDLLPEFVKALEPIYEEAR